MFGPLVVETGRAGERPDGADIPQLVERPREVNVDGVSGVFEVCSVELRRICPHLIGIDIAEPRGELRERVLEGHTAGKDVPGGVVLREPPLERVGVDVEAGVLAGFEIDRDRERLVDDGTVDAELTRRDREDRRTGIDAERFDIDHHAGGHRPTSGATPLKWLQLAYASMQSFGINVDDEVAEKIEDRRVRITEDGSREIDSRSKVCNRLLRLGLVAAEALDDAEFEVPEGHPREAMIRQAVVDQVFAEQREE